MQLREIVLDHSLRELTVRGQPDYPVAVYENDMAGFLNGSVPWHWHQEIELVRIRRGTLIVETEGQRLVLREGEGAFLNAGVLHRMSREGSRTCQMCNIVFAPQIISGTESSLIHSRYLLPLLHCTALPILKLSREIPWQGRALELMEQTARTWTGQEELWELALRQQLTELWTLLLRENRQALAQREQRDPRLKTMLLYLQEHMAEPVRLEDAAAAAGVSPRECTRCFRRHLDTTPMAYLIQLRIRTAAAMLERTDDPVTEIGLAVGFGSPSYFGKVFRESTGLSPREYRQRFQKEGTGTART